MAFQPGEGWASSGWAENCGISLWTLDRLDCSPTPECLPWLGSGWVEGCVDQLYSLSWICCDIIIGEPPKGSGGGRGGKIFVRKPEHFDEDIEFDSDIEELKVVVYRIRLAQEKGIIPEAAITYQMEIDRFEMAIEQIEEKINVVNDEINFLEDFTDVDVQLRREFLIDAVEEAEEFKLKLIGEVEILKIFKRRRQDEETMLAILMQQVPDTRIFIQ